ncbi:CPBP family intramembrane glutamic endopeptidase [Agromyces larvae]|uniref:CPBP family intramembrane metalloprotease n=1 Tax=Agromyces larvae TaxID=2929802 RepID=A0ABY4BWG7_9MICO|nr:type II CAAX endopeptidase family protein [Agromyces larvae]UOE43572.1 CPBP family intramembrane metalloprotease [Agromyces larvae]
MGAPTTDRVPRVLWVGLVAALVYYVVAGGGGAVFNTTLPSDIDPVASLALSHLTILPVLIAIGLAFAWFSGWWRDIWTTPRISSSRPRRWWLYVVPLVLALQVVVMLVDAPWASLSAAYIFVGLIAYLLVGLGEELFFRGILLQSVRSHHGETVTLLVTAFVFGLGHSVNSAFLGVPVSGIAFQVIVTAAAGVLYYAAFRVTGTLWVPIVLHGLGDYGRWLLGGDGQDHTTPGDIWLQGISWVLAVAVLVSTIREDRRTHRERRQSAPDTDTETEPVRSER